MALIVNAAMLRGAIKARKLTLRSVAHQASMSEGHLRSLTSGRRAATTAATAEQLARVIGIPLVFIVDDDTA